MIRTVSKLMLPDSSCHAPVSWTQHWSEPGQHLTSGLITEISPAHLDNSLELLLEANLGLEQTSHGDTRVIPELIQFKQR